MLALKIHEDFCDESPEQCFHREHRGLEVEKLLLLFFFFFFFLLWHFAKRSINSQIEEVQYRWRI